MEAHHRLRKKLKEMLSRAGAHPLLMDHKLYFGQDVPIGWSQRQPTRGRVIAGALARLVQISLLR